MGRCAVCMHLLFALLPPKTFSRLFVYTIISNSLSTRFPLVSRTLCTEYPVFIFVYHARLARPPKFYHFQANRKYMWQYEVGVSVVLPLACRSRTSPPYHLFFAIGSPVLQQCCINSSPFPYRLPFLHFDSFQLRYLQKFD